MSCGRSCSCTLRQLCAVRSTLLYLPSWGMVCSAPEPKAVLPSTLPAADYSPLCAADYYFTGDGAYRTKKGYYQITGRMDDVINISGHRLGTAEIEDAMVSCKQVEVPCQGLPLGQGGPLKEMVCFQNLTNVQKQAAPLLRRQQMGK